MSRGKADICEAQYALPQIVIRPRIEYGQVAAAGRVQRGGYTSAVWRPPLYEGRLRWRHGTVREDDWLHSAKLRCSEGNTSLLRYDPRHYI